MTTVAVKDGIMASDSRATYNGMIETNMTKIHRLKSGALLGQAGDNDVRDVIKLLEHSKPNTLPSRGELQNYRIDFLGIILFPDKRIFKISTTNKLLEAAEEDLGIWEVSFPYAAIGSGGDFALGAMAAGRSARQAVAVAMRFDPNSGGTIHTATPTIRRRRK